MWHRQSGNFLFLIFASYLKKEFIITRNDTDHENWKHDNHIRPYEFIVRNNKLFNFKCYLVLFIKNIYWDIHLSDHSNYGMLGLSRNYRRGYFNYLFNNRAVNNGTPCVIIKNGMAGGFRHKYAMGINYSICNKSVIKL